MRDSLSLLEAHLANISSDPAAEFTVSLFFLDSVEQSEARGSIGLVSSFFTSFELRGNSLQARAIRRTAVVIEAILELPSTYIHPYYTISASLHPNIEHGGDNNSISDREYEAALAKATDKLDHLLNLHDRIGRLVEQSFSSQASIGGTLLLFKEHTIIFADPRSSVLLERRSVESVVQVVNHPSTCILPEFTNNRMQSLDAESHQGNSQSH